MSEQLIQAVVECGAVVNGHFVFNSGRHSDSIFDAGPVIQKADEKLAGWITIEILSGITGEIDIVLGVASLGNDLAEWCGQVLNAGIRKRVRVIKTRKVDGRLELNDLWDRIYRVFENKRVLVVDDVITTGGSVKKAMELVRNEGAKVVGVAVLCSHGAITAKSLGIPEFSTAVTLLQKTYAPVLCPMCINDGYESIRTDLGHGQEFLDKLQQSGGFRPSGS